MKCPKCREELESLWQTDEAVVSYHVELDDEDGSLRYEEVDIDSVGGQIEYGCHNCLVVLAYTEPDAMAILKGELTQELAEKFAEIALSGE